MASQSITKLAAEWRRLIDDFNSKEVDDAIDTPLFKKIVAIEAKIVRAAFKTAADLLIGLKILLEDRHWDDFQIALFKRMQQFA